MPSFRFLGSLDIKKMKAKNEVKGLTKALQHKTEEIRYKAALALGDMNNKQVTESLIQTLHDESQVVRRNVAFALSSRYHIAWRLYNGLLWRVELDSRNH